MILKNKTYYEVKEERSDNSHLRSFRWQNYSRGGSILDPQSFYWALRPLRESRTMRLAKA